MPPCGQPWDSATLIDKSLRATMASEPNPLDSSGAGPMSDQSSTYGVKGGEVECSFYV
jgi:hypothetical protein